MVYLVYMKQVTIEEIKQKSIPILKAAGIKRSDIFGSYARGEQNENSDIDILVEFPEGKTLYDLIELEDRLKKILQKDVDVVTYNSISQHLKKYIFSDQTQLL